MYRRPYPHHRRGANPPPPFDRGVPPLARHPLPDGPAAATAIVRFVGQVLVASTIAVFSARLVGAMWPATARTLLGGAAAALLVVAVFKWLWKGRTSGVPWIYGLTCAAGVIWIVSMILAAPSLFALMGVIFVAYLVAISAHVARAADGVTAQLDSGTSFALAGCAALLFGVAALPLSFDTTRALAALTTCVNTVFALLVAVTYVGFVLAHPGQPRSVIDGATARWKRILRCEEPQLLNPYLTCAIVCVLTVVVVACVDFRSGAPERYAQSAAHEVGVGEQDGMDGRTLAAWVSGAVVGVLLAARVVAMWLNRRVIGRALTVWMMYDGQPTPGVYRPRSWVGSARRRQLLLAGVLFLNVLLMRDVFFAFDAQLLLRPGQLPRTFWVQPEPSGARNAIVFLAYLASFIAPAFMPVSAFTLLYRREVRAVHDLVEESAPPELYPPHKETDRG